MGGLCLIGGGALCLVWEGLCLMGEGLCLMGEGLCLMGEGLCLMGEGLCLMGEGLCLMGGGAHFLQYAEVLFYHPHTRLLHKLVGHRGEISNALFNYNCSLIATGSMDKTCKLWDPASGKCVTTLRYTLEGWDGEEGGRGGMGRREGGVGWGGGREGGKWYDW